jgi:hypothetical protein
MKIENEGKINQVHQINEKHSPLYCIAGVILLA